MNAEDLINFEKEIADIYESGDIKAPVHLRDGNEDMLCKIFQQIRQQDFVFCSWASHLHCLLKGVPVDRVKKDILEGRSITLNYPEYNLFSSAIVGGTSSIAAGTAWSLNQQNKDARAYCFLGDMSFQTGIANESIRYSIGHNLPVTWVIEDNGVSVGTETEPTCGINTRDLADSLFQLKSKYNAYNVDIIYYAYKMSYPHSGTGVFVEF
tara:strand:+ start:1609 stop:2238 length:630 start_codon:yes stop_codon:yes gene_type:complete